MAGRAYETSRLEGFSDTVFGFALTLLVVSLEVPFSFEALRQQMEGFFGFLTASLMGAWFGLGAEPPAMEAGNALLLLYSGGVVLIFGTFRLLYRHAFRNLTHRSTSEQIALSYAARAHTVSLSVGLTSCAIAFVGYLGNWDILAALAGSVYFLTGPLHGWNGHLAAKALTADEAVAPHTIDGGVPHA